MMSVSQAAMAAYVLAMVRTFAPASPPGKVLAQWLHDHQGLVGVDFDTAMQCVAGKGKTPEDPDLEKPLPRAVWEVLCAQMARAIQETAREPDLVSANIDLFAAAVGLDELERAIFRFVYYTDSDSSFGALCTRIIGTRSVDTQGLAAMCLDAGAAEIWARLRRGPLQRLGIVGVANNASGSFAYFVPDRLVRALQPPSVTLADMERRLIGAPLLPHLSAADYEHVARERDFLLRLLRGALRDRRKGVNILVYGVPGTGKTEFCKVLARALGCDLFSVGEADEEGSEPSRWERLDALRLGDQLAGGRGKSLLLFDEMEDVLWDRMRRSGSKVFLNRLLEKNQVPVLWTANDIGGFDPAFLRRMTFAFEMKPMSKSARIRLWTGYAAREGLQLAPGQAERLARQHIVSPGLMTGAVGAVSMANGGAEEIDFVIGSLAKSSGVVTPVATAGGAFTPELTNADLDLCQLQAALAAPGAPRDYALCLYGPPGTGKSAFARELAAATGLEPVIKRGSDLLSKWIGETERKLAAAFETARQDGAFLIIDEVDGLLWSREGATRSWEVSMVNEFLVQLETHPLPFACTTNHLDRIDPAALRRFTFKIRFDYMTAPQARAAYRQFFDVDPPARLDSLQHLTPGDFAVVAKKRRMLTAGKGEPNLVRLLEQEVEAKNLRVMRMGF
jgi:tRNA A37 threonylcarbamoyladenosine biosynthesis protein TsaE